MSLKTIFKRLVLLQLLFFILFIFLIFVPASEEVTRFNDYSIQQNSNINMVFVLYGIYMLGSLIILLLLYKFKSIAKPAYLFLYILGAILVLLSGPIAMDSWIGVLDGIAMTVSGGILVLLYFSPIKKEFDK